MKIINTTFLLVSLILIGCSKDTNSAPDPIPDPVKKPDLSTCSPEISVTFVWQSRNTDARGYSLAFGKSKVLSQRVDVHNDENSYKFSENFPIQRGENLFIAIGAIRSNGNVNYGPTNSFSFPSCEDLDKLLDENPKYPYETNYILEIKNDYDYDYEDYESANYPDYLGGVSKKPAGEVIDLTDVDHELTEIEHNLKDYLSAPIEDVSRITSPEPGILLKQKFDLASRANLTDIPFPEEMPDQLCVEFMDKNPVKAQYSTLFKYQHVIPEVPDIYPGQLVTKVLAGSEVGISDFNIYENKLTEDSLYVGERSDLETKGRVVRYFIRKAEDLIFYKKVTEYRDRKLEEDSGDDESEEDKYDIKNITYYGYCYGKNSVADYSDPEKLNSSNDDNASDDDDKNSGESKIPEFEGDMQNYETELVVRLQNLLLDSGEGTIFNTIAERFLASSERADIYDFRYSGMEDYECQEVQNYDRNSSLVRGLVNLFTKKVVKGYGPLFPEIILNKVVTGERNIINNLDKYRMYNTSKSLVSYYVTERNTEREKVSFIRRSGANRKWYYLRYERRLFTPLSGQRQKNEVFFAGVCQ